MRGQRHAPDVLPQGKRPGTHFTGGWLAPGSVWTGAKSLNLSGLDLRTVQAVVSLYIDYSIPVHHDFKYVVVF